jgi:chromosome segregation ATPase
MTSNPNYTDDETTPVGIQRTQTNGSVGSVSSFGLKVRPVSRATSRAGNNANDEEIERLRAQLEDRDRQLKDQAAALAEMESSLTELQGLIENSDGPPRSMARRSSLDDKDTAQLRALVREKNEKIAMLTAEFDGHRADFRSTIDTLEMASTETERVYEKKIEELMQEIQELQDRTADVDNIAAQLKQLEELVQELEEGLEDARRGEAEARGEVEFLRGEVERTRTELRREREKAQAAMNGGANGGSMLKELEQKEDEIRGLKAIIHSLSRDSVPNGNPNRTPTQRSVPFRPHQGESIEDRLTREKLDREVAELRALIESKTSREEELERELEALRRGSIISSSGPGQRGSGMTIVPNQRSSLRDSRGTVVMAPSRASLEAQHNRGRTLDTMPESDSYSTATEHSTLWCEICETSGHDILTCTNVFGSSEQHQHQQSQGAGGLNVNSNINRPDGGGEDLGGFKPAPLSPIKTKPAAPSVATSATTPTAPQPSARTIPNPMESGPVAGKDSGVVDAGKWCALCERDGHDSVDCPFEDAF